MQFKHVIIDSLSYATPQRVCTSASIEEHLQPLYERLKLQPGRLELMTGIIERRFWEEPTVPSVAAAQAAKPLLSQEPVDLLIHASICRDRLEPATAAYVHYLLGLEPQTLFFDLSSACLGFLKAMVVAAGLIESGQIKRALIVSAEDGEPLLKNTLRELLAHPHTRQSIKPYFANLTIGAGAVAMGLCHESVASSQSLGRLSHATHCVDTAATNLCEGDHAQSGYTMATHSEALLQAGIALSRAAWIDFKQQTGCDTFERVITHQVGREHTRQLYAALEIPEALNFATYSHWGNVGSVSTPLTLACYLEQVKTLTGPVALLGIGSGLATTMINVSTL